MLAHLCGTNDILFVASYLREDEGGGIWIKLGRAMADLRVISLPSHLAFTIKSLILHKRLIDGLPGIVPSMHPQCLRIFKSLRALALTGLARAEWFKGGNKMCFRAQNIELHQRYSQWTKCLSVNASYCIRSVVKPSSVVHQAYESNEITFQWFQWFSVLTL